MKTQTSWLRIWLGVLLCIGGAWGLFRAKPPEKTIVLGDACRTPARVMGPATPSAPVAIVFHGFAASAAIMEPLGQSLAEAGWRVYLLDLAGHGRSGEHFSYARVDQCAASAAQFLKRTGVLVPRRTIYVGHSLGAAVVLHLAGVLPSAATVAISPALVVPPKRTPPNLLVLAGQFDLGPVRQTARQMLRDAGGVRESAADFAQGRAVALGILSGQLHGTMVLDPRAWKRTIAWADRSLPPGTAQVVTSAPVARPLAALFSNFLLLAGMALLVAPAMMAMADLFRLPPCKQGTESDSQGRQIGWKTIAAQWAAAAFSAVCIVGLLHIDYSLRPTRLEDGDWTALVALLTGLFLIVLVRRTMGKELAPNAAWLNFALLAGLVLVVLFSWAARPELLQSALSGARLWRWPVLAAFVCPYFLAEEAALGPPGGTQRFLKFVVMRGLLFLAEVFAVLIFWPSGLLIALLGIGLAIISIGQRLAADALRRRGAGVAAAAIFDAILAAGTLALILPLI